MSLPSHRAASRISTRCQLAATLRRRNQPPINPVNDDAGAYQPIDTAEISEPVMTTVFDGPDDMPTGPNLLAAAIGLVFCLLATAIAIGLIVLIWTGIHAAGAWLFEHFPTLFPIDPN